MLQLGWRYRSTCRVVLLLNIVLVGFNLAGLSFTGLAIDVLRHAMEPTALLRRIGFSG